MGDLPEGPPVVGLPERFDRRLRLGPFPSARAALKFVTYAAVGAVLAPFTSPYLWLTLVATGFVLSVFRWDGPGLDEQAVACGLWALRGAFGDRSMSAPTAVGIARENLVNLGAGQYVAILRAGGTPIAYLPPAELARRFEGFRDVLRSLRGTLAFQVTSASMDADPVTPPGMPPDRGDRPAWAGYSELVTLLCRRRSVRRIYLVLPTETSGPDGIADLETRVRGLTERLVALGLRPVRLRNRALEDAARSWGWTWAHPAK